MKRSSNKKKILGDENKIIQQLIDDPRQSPREIAEQCGFSRQKVWRIINKLEGGKKIWGYTTVVSDDNIGREVYIVLIKAKAALVDIVDRVVRDVTGKKISDKLDINVFGVYYLNGLYDWIIIFSAEDIWVAKNWLGFIQKKFGDYIMSIDIMENVFPVIKFGKINPNIEQLLEFGVS